MPLYGEVRYQACVVFVKSGFEHVAKPEGVEA